MIKGLKIKGGTKLDQDIDLEKYQRMINEIKKYQEKANFPDNEEDLKELKETIKIEKYFDLLPNISIEKGWKVDYGYHKDQHGGSPRIFAYKKCYQTELNQNKYLPPNKAENYLKHINLDGTKDSYLQYIILILLGNQFALYWHSNYNDKEIIFTKNAIEKILKRKDDYFRFEEKFKDIARNINPEPNIKINIEKVLVRIVIFTKWGGFIEHTYHIDRNFPRQLLPPNQR